MRTSDPYKNLEDQLRGAVEQRAPAPEPPRRRRFRFTWPRGGAIPILLGAVVLGGGVATAAVVAQHRSTATPLEQIRQAMDAGSKAMRTLPACHQVRGTKPRLVSEPVPAWLTARLGILRRPQTAADRTTGAYEHYAVDTTILSASRRVAAEPDGWSYRFRLERGPGAFYGSQADPVGCAQGVRAATLGAATSFPPAVQQQIRNQEDREVAAIDRLVSGKSLQYTISEIRPDGIETSTGGGTLGETIPATSGMSSYHHGRIRGHSVYSLIPDGIATVRLIDTSGTPRLKPRTIKVVDNFFHTLLPRHFGPTLTLQWRSPSGRVVRATHLHF